VVLNYLFVTLGLKLNAGTGDPYEIVHKTFVWPYLAVSTWCGCAIAAWLGAQGPMLRKVLLLTAFPLTLLVLGAKVDECADQLQTAFIYPGSDAGSRVTVPRAAFDTAEFIRESTPTQALVQGGVSDGSLMLQSLMERRFYFNLPAHASASTEVVAQANAELAALLSASTQEEFCQRARQRQIDYFVLYPGQQPLWATSMQPVFQSGEYRVYRI
jgi:hypothetical protein